MRRAPRPRMTTNDSDNVKHFDAATAPVNPFSGARLAGWYYRDAAGTWNHVGNADGDDRVARQLASRTSGRTR